MIPDKSSRSHPPAVQWILPILAVALLLAAASPRMAAASDEPAPTPAPIQSDQPAAIPGHTTMSPGVVQFELGLRALYDNDRPSTGTVDLLVRGFVADHLELRFGLPKIHRFQKIASFTFTSTLTDMLAGLKWQVVRDRLQLSLLFDLIIPIRDGGIGQGRLHGLFHSPLFDGLSMMAGLGAFFDNVLSGYIGAGLKWIPDPALTLIGQIVATADRVDSVNRALLRFDLDFTMGIMLIEVMQLDLAIQKSLKDAETIRFYAGISIALGR